MKNINPNLLIGVVGIAVVALILSQIGKAATAAKAAWDATIGDSVTPAPGTITAKAYDWATEYGYDKAIDEWAPYLAWLQKRSDFITKYGWSNAVYFPTYDQWLIGGMPDMVNVKLPSIN